MKYPEKWTVKHEMTIRLKIAAVTHAILLLQKINISRSIHILRMFSEAFLTKNAWPGNISMASAKKSNLFFFLFMVVHTYISYISLNFTHICYIIFFILHCREYKRCIFEMTQILQKNLQLQLSDNQNICVITKKYFKVCQQSIWHLVNFIIK